LYLYILRARIPRMSLVELKKGLAFLRQLHSPSEEEGTFVANIGQPQHHEDIRLDRLVILPAYQNAVYPVLERHIDQEDLTPVIEVGCGTGFFSRDLAPRWLRDRIVSFDLNSPSLRVLVENDSRAQVFKASSYRMPVKDQVVAAVIGYSSFDSMLFLDVALRETNRILVPGGKLVLFQDLTTDLYESGRGSSLQSVEAYHKILIEEAENQGFIILEGREDLLEAKSVEPTESVKRRVSDFDLEERDIPLAAIMDRGSVYPPGIRAGNSERKRVSKEEIMEDLAQGVPRMQAEGLFDNLDAKAGDLVSSLKMRYLVLQKPH